MTKTAARSDRTTNAPTKSGKRVVGRPFQKGNPGRPKGIVDRRTWAKRQVLTYLAEGDADPTAKGALKPRADRLKELLTCNEKSIRFQTEKLVAEHDWGRPKETIELQGEVKIGDLVKGVHSRVRKARA